MCALYLRITFVPCIIKPELPARALGASQGRRRFSLVDPACYIPPQVHRNEMRSKSYVDSVILSSRNKCCDRFSIITRRPDRSRFAVAGSSLQPCGCGCCTTAFSHQATAFRRTCAHLSLLVDILSHGIVFRCVHCQGFSLAA